MQVNFENQSVMVGMCWLCCVGFEIGLMTSIAMKSRVKLLGRIEACTFEGMSGSFVHNFDMH